MCGGAMAARSVMRIGSVARSHSFHLANFARAATRSRSLTVGDNRAICVVGRHPEKLIAHSLRFSLLFALQTNFICETARRSRRHDEDRALANLQKSKHPSNRSNYVIGNISVAPRLARTSQFTVAMDQISRKSDIF